MNRVRVELGYDPRHWTSEDGHRHVSVPTDVPEKWSPRYEAEGLKWFSQQGHYAILRQKADGPYTVFRDGVELPLSICSRLKDAKAYAVRNAQGKHEVNVA